MSSILCQYGFTAAAALPLQKKWTDLPSELLTKIAYNLGFKDLLCFRAICKDWRAASFPCFAEIESSGKPWLLVSQLGSNSCYMLYNPLEKTTYNINIPEMEGTLCLGSDRGWLLLSRQNQLFFFCPFTKAKVELPKFPHSDLADHLAAFTHSPTCQECVVIVAYYCSNRELELHMIQRGENKWNRIVHKHNNVVSTPLTSASYSKVEEKFIYLNISDPSDDNSGARVVTFSPKKSSFTSNRIIVTSDRRKSTYNCRNSWNYMDKQVLEVLEIKENADIIPTCGPIVEKDGKFSYYWNKNINKTSEKSQKVIFIHPRFHQIPASQGWFGYRWFSFIY